MERRLYLFSLVVLSMLFGMQISGMEQSRQSGNLVLNFKLSDGQQVFLPKDIAKISPTLKDMLDLPIEGDDDQAPIPLTTIDRVTFEKLSNLMSMMHDGKSNEELKAILAAINESNLLEKVLIGADFLALERIVLLTIDIMVDRFYECMQSQQSTLTRKIDCVQEIMKINPVLRSKIAQALKDRMPVTLKRTYNRYVSQPNVVATLQGHTHWINSVAISPDGQYVVTGSSDRTARIWNMATGALKHTLQGHTHWISSVAISPDGQYVVTGSLDDTARIWDMATGALVHTLQGHTDLITSVVISPDGQYVVTGSRDGTARIWDMATGALKHTLTGHTLSINSVAISPDGQYVVTGSWDRTARIWNMATGALVRALTGYADLIASVVISPDGQYVVTGSLDGMVRIWNMATGALKHTLTGYTNEINSVVISPDGQYVVTGSDDRKARIWDMATGALKHTLTGHTSLISSVAISPDGQYVVTGSWDRTARIWNMATGALVCALQGHTNEIISVEISPDGQYVVTGSWDSTARIWQIQVNVLDHDEAQQLSLEQMLLLVLYADAKSRNPAVTFNNVKNMYTSAVEKQMLQAIFDSGQNLPDQLKTFMGIPMNETTILPSHYVEQTKRGRYVHRRGPQIIETE